MCAIAGVANIKSDGKIIVEKMINTMNHRGPDGEGIVYYDEDGIALGHKRLAIVDLSEKGSQPMVSFNSRYTIVLNGEIYNFSKLRNTLINANNVQTFRGSSDTEILLEYYAKYGLEKTLNDINGMYAFAIYDKKEKKLVLARDRAGEKPLYYGFLREKFVFASELKAIKEIAEANELQISETAAKLFLRYSFIPQPLTIYENIYKLKAGHYIILEKPFNSILCNQKYWELGEKKIETSSISYEESKKEVKKLIQSSIQRQMVMDVPYGAFLSGGVDSSLVTSIMANSSGTPISTFSIGFDIDGFDEAKYAREIASRLGCKHTEKYFEKKDLINLIPKMSSIYDEPLADISQLAMCLLSKTARDKVTVCLSGDCGDELFMGYPHYKKNVEMRKRYPKQINSFVGKGVKLLSPIDERFFLKGKNIESLYGETFWDNYFSSSYFDDSANLTVTKEEYLDWRMSLIEDVSDFQNQMCKWDFYTATTDMIFAKVDRAAMAYGLEVRIPFLDKELMEFCYSLPVKYKIHEERPKAILKDILSEFIPLELFERPKQGFAVPMYSYLRNELKDWAETYIYGHQLYDICSFLNATKIQRKWKKFLQNNTRYGMVEWWRICILGQWISENV